MRTGVLILLATVAAAAFAGTAVEDAERDFRELNRERQRITELLSLRMDINGDGVEEVFMSTAEDTNGRAGNMWTVYTRSANGLKCHIAAGGKEIVFRPDLFAVRHIDELSTCGIYAFYPAGGGTRAVVAYTYDGAQLHMHDLGSTRTVDGDPQVFPSHDCISTPTLNRVRW